LQSAVSAEKAVFLASGGRWVVGRWGRPSIFVRIGSLGPRCPRFEFPGGDGEAAASSPLWNKFLQPRPCLAGDRSVSGKGSVGIGIPRSGVSAGIPRPGSFCTGVCRRLLRPRPVMQATMVVSRFIAKDGAAAGSEACGCADLGASSIFWWRPQILGHGGGMGCVPGRWSSQVVIFSPSRVRCFCGSSQSFSSDGAFHGPWVRASVSVWLRSRLLRHRFLAAAVVGDSGRQSVLMGLRCNFLFLRGFSASLVGTVVLCILCVCTSRYAVVVRFP
jgi:hypothetical protein